MNSRLRFTLSALMWAAILIAAYAASVHAQNGAKDNHQRSDNGLVTQVGMHGLKSIASRPSRKTGAGARVLPAS
jgi:hypothetical protein